jgi:Tfp pilus assembly protein PilE
MKAGAGPKPLVVALAVVVVAVVAYGGYTTYKKRALDATIVASIQDASRRLHSALTLSAGPTEAITVQAAERIGQDAEDVGRQLQALRRADAASDMALVDAADSYLVTAGELLKRIAGSHRHRLMLADSTQALRDHLRVDTRTGAWVSEAVRGKARMDKDFRGFRIDSEVVDKLLESFHESQKMIAPYVGVAALIDEKLVADARRRASAELKRASAEKESFRLR